MKYTALYSSPLGNILITAEDEAIVSLVFTDPDVRTNSTITPPLHKCIHWLDDYFAGSQPDPATLPIHLTGSAFQQKVWKILTEIPYGQSTTYRQIAKQIGSNMSAQAVGGAVGSNPISIIVPCHRVLGAGGRLTGYAYGLDIKRGLLDLERISYRE